VLRVGVAADGLRRNTDALCRAVARLAFGIRAVHLVQHRLINLQAERTLNGFEVHAMAVRRQLIGVVFFSFEPTKDQISSHCARCTERFRIRPRLGLKFEAVGAPNVGAAGCGASVCAETSQGMRVIPVHRVIVIKNAYAGCPMGRDYRFARLRQGVGAAGV
jgi:hypothetical protein